MASRRRRLPWSVWRWLPDCTRKRLAYYRSPPWQALREQVKERSGGWCEWCRWRRARDVHHLTYVRLYRELLEDLMHLCRFCHRLCSAPECNALHQNC